MKTTPEYWDCECESNYIHPKNQRTCSECNARHEDQPDSHLSEVIAAGLPLNDIRNMLNTSDVNTLLEAARVALADADIFDQLCDDLDVNDEHMLYIRERLEAYMGRSDV
jgi:hypothetical protein